MSLDYSAAIKAVQDIGKVLKEQFGKIQPYRSKSESAVDVVTQLDIEVELFLAEKLNQHYPSIGFRGEENGLQHNAEMMWLVDPIDGTSHFIRGIPFCTTMVALIDKNEVIFSIIYDFVRDELYTATKNRGAFLNGAAIKVSERPLKDAYLTVEANLNIPKNVESFLSLKKKAVVLETITCGYECALIASGKIDGRVSIDPHGKDWDYAAGALLVAEAGGIVTNIGKKTYNYQNHNFLATNKVVYEELTTGNNPLFPIEVDY